MPDKNPAALTLPRAVVHDTVRNAFRHPRAFTIVANGGLSLLLACLRADRAQREHDRLFDVVAELAAVAGTTADRLDVLLQQKGRPSRTLMEVLRSSETETALQAAFLALGWDDLLALVAPFSGSGAGAAEGVEALPPRERVDRVELLAALWRRAVEIEGAWSAAPESWSVLRTIPLHKRTVSTAAQLVGLPTSAAELGPIGEAQRYPNRAGRLLAARIMHRWEETARAQKLVCAPKSALSAPLSVVAAVAESVGRSGKARNLVVAQPGEQVEMGAWSPLLWWPVLDTWGTSTRALQGLRETRWRLSRPEADVVMWALLWAWAWAETALEFDGASGDEPAWAEHVRARLDGRWSVFAAGVWDTVQSVRTVSLRTPWPSGFASSSTLSAVSPDLSVSVDALPSWDAGVPIER